MTSSVSHVSSGGLHTAIIMDGNGRWALRRGLPRIAGHRAGAEALRRTVEAAVKHGIGTLTVYAFSSDNWNRPKEEVGTLMKLFLAWLRSEVRRCIDNGVRVTVIGRRDRLPRLMLPAIEECESRTAHGTRLHLRLAVDYSARDQLLAAARCPGATANRAALNCALGSPDVDLLIRTGGEQRLSDFLLWECAYAELYFTPRLWPDFGPEDLSQALAEFHTRDRRFGGLPAVVSSRG